MKLICGDPGYVDDRQFPSLHQWSSLKLQPLVSLSNECKSGNLSVQLYNLTSDPGEHYDVHGENPELVALRLHRLAAYEAFSIPPHMAEESEAGNPNNFGGFFSPGWCTAEP